MYGYPLVWLHFKAGIYEQNKKKNGDCKLILGRISTEKVAKSQDCCDKEEKC